MSAIARWCFRHRSAVIAAWVLVLVGLGTLSQAVKSREPEGNRTRVTVEVWCENQDGVQTMVGTASGLE